MSSNEMPLIVVLFSHLAEIGVRTAFVVTASIAFLLFEELDRKAGQLAAAKSVDPAGDSSTNGHFSRKLCKWRVHYDLVNRFTEKINSCFGLILLLMTSMDFLASIIEFQNIMLSQRRNPLYFFRFFHIILRHLIIVVTSHRVTSKASGLRETLVPRDSSPDSDEQLQVNTLLMQASELPAEKISAMNVIHFELSNMWTLLDNAFQWGVIVCVAVLLARSESDKLEQKSLFFKKMIEFGEMLTNCVYSEDSSPCQFCDDESIACGNIPLSFIAKSFFEKETKTVGTFLLTIPATEEFVPKNLVNNLSVTECYIKCINIGRQRIKIHKDAFESSRNVTTTFDIEFCDISRLDFLFLKDFDKLESLTISTCVDVHLADWIALPFLVSLNYLTIKESKGLDRWTRFPVMIKGLTWIEMRENEMDDTTIDRILQWAMDSQSSTTLHTLDIRQNALTRIPQYISSFKSLTSLYMSFNPLMTIPSGSLTFLSPAVRKINLNNCGIRFIEPGAFEGKFSNAIIRLDGNELAQFESGVFEKMLRPEKFVVNPSIVLVFVTNNPFDCKDDLCHLAWIIRDNPELLNSVENAKCSNGSLFISLNPGSFEHCPHQNNSFP